MERIDSLSFERALLATILYNPNVFGDIESELSPKDFSYEQNGAVFAIMSELYKADLPLDDNYIISRCGKKGKDFENFKANFLEIAATSAIVDTKGYIAEIRNLSLKRKLHTLAVSIQEKSQDNTMSSAEIIDNIEREVFNLENSTSSGNFRRFDEVTKSMLEQLLKIKERGNNVLIGLNTGFRELNRTTNGFKKGELIILAARPGMGKTAFALNAILPTLKEKKAVALFSLEMGAEQLLTRLYAMETNIPLQKLISGDLSENDWQFLNDVCAKSAEWKLFIDDGGNLNISNLKSKIRRLKLKEPDLSLVVVDYLQIMSGVGNKDRHLEIAEISRGLKNLARELGIPILALSQLNRMLESREDRRPMLSDLRESGAIEQDADIVLFLYRGQIYEIRDQKKRLEEAKKNGKDFKEPLIVQGESEEVELIIGKHRNGELKTIKIVMHPKYTRFSNKEFFDQSEQSPTKMLDNDANIDMPI